MDEQVIININQRLNRIATALLAVCLLVAAAGEFGILPLGIVPEDYVYNMQIVACVLTVVCVPVALKLLSWRRVRCCVANDPEEYCLWATKRLLMIYIPMLVDIALHYLLMDMSPFYLALICAVAVLYVWPSKVRMRQETQKETWE